jgi:hypothetical protein
MPAERDEIGQGTLPAFAQQGTLVKTSLCTRHQAGLPFEFGLRGNSGRPRLCAVPSLAGGRKCGCSFYAHSYKTSNSFGDRFSNWPKYFLHEFRFR